MSYVLNISWHVVTLNSLKFSGSFMFFSKEQKFLFVLSIFPLTFSKSAKDKIIFTIRQ